MEGRSFVVKSPVMRRWRQLGIAIAIGTAALLVVAALAPFLAPTLSYQVRDRARELIAGRGSRPYRIALGAPTGSYSLLGPVINKYLKEKGYELELVRTGGIPENVAALRDPARDVQLAAVDSASDEAVSANDVYALAAIERPYFFVIVPNDSTVREIRDLAGPVDTAARAEGEGPTIGDKVLEYYGLVAHPDARAAGAAPPAVTAVRPVQGTGMLRSLDEGRVTALTRTQFLPAGLVDNVLNTGRYRIVPIPDHEALARSIPGAEPGFIPAGAYGAQRRIPPAPVPTLVFTSMIVARADLPGRVVRDILETLYDPRFSRDTRYELTEADGQKTGHLRLHPAAELYYHRNDLVTSDRLGRLSFVASAIAGIFATIQFVLLSRRNEQRKARRRLLLAELEKLRVLRLDIAAADKDDEAAALIQQADELLARAEREAAEDRIDHDGIETVRSLHGICWRVFQNRRDRTIQA
jgi:TRAP-type uncharacterized transport system substrate-binding protein